MLASMSASLRHRCPLFSVAVVAMVAFALPAHAAAPPKGGCPMPANSLVLSELQVGIGAKPRWLEILNPGDEAVSLNNVVVRLTAKGIGGAAPTENGVLEFNLGDTVDALPSGEVLLIGHLPPDPGGGKPPGPYFGLSMLDMGPGFVLPVCDVKLEILSPSGPIDLFKYNLCAAGTPPSGDAVWQTAFSLDPAHADICDNDDVSTWCQTTAAGSPAKPTPGKPNDHCDLDGDGYTFATGDCDDANKQTSPIALEACNGVDDDCDGSTDEGAAAPVDTCLSLGICAGPLPDGSPVASCQGKAGFVCTYPYGYESVSETLCDGFDNDCDGETDEGLQNACGGCGPVPVELCNGKDDDCDGETDELPDLSAQACGGPGVCKTAHAICTPDGPACALPEAHQVTETRCDGLDNDCDGQTDEELGLGQDCTAGQGQCAAAGVLACAPDGAVRCVAVTAEPGAEVCGNNLDDDCDGETDEEFGIGEQCSVGLGICRVFGKRVCRATDDGSPSTSSICLANPTQPEDVEWCGNDLDDDCDGFTDEPGCTRVGAAEPSCQSTPGAGRSDAARGAWWLLGMLAFGLTALRRYSKSSSST